MCGEHGGDPESIQTFAAAGLDYVSCSPFRVPIARLAAAQAVLAGHTDARDRELAAQAAKAARGTKAAAPKKAAVTKKAAGTRAPAKKAAARR